jgi:hypothetical protein
MTLPPQAGGRRSLFAISTIAILASVAALYLYGYRPYAKAAATSYLAHEINTKLSALIKKPRTVELTSEKAIRARHAIKQEDYSTAEKIIASVLTSSRVENWRFYPFADFIEDVVDPNDPTFEAKLTAWAARNESDAIPLLVRAGYSRCRLAQARPQLYGRDSGSEHGAVSPGYGSGRCRHRGGDPSRRQQSL